MGTDTVKWFGNLQEELDDAKHTLVQLNDNIRRIIGRRSDKFRTMHDAKKSDPERTIQKSSLEVTKHKRRNNDAKSVFNRLSAVAPRAYAHANVEEEHRPRLTSRIIREMPSRQDVVAAQGADSESRARNRRMFGSLLGTLQKFCQEESRLKDREQKKADIEKKLEEQQLQERATLKKEREALFLDRKRKQMEIRTLETKMHRIKDYEVWEASTLHLTNFIRTKAKPHIYYKPRNSCKKLDKLAAESKQSLEQELAQKREALNNELIEIEQNMKTDNLDGDEQMENIERNNEHPDEEDMCMDDELNRKERSKNRRRNYDAILNATQQKNGDLEARDYKSKKSTEHSISSRVVVVKSHRDRDSY